jgi:16S rRNA C967 or C1407 C5-methylase (RsmB/RsmF family)
MAKKTDQQKYQERSSALIERWSKIYSLSATQAEGLLNLKQSSACKINDFAKPTLSLTQLLAKLKALDVPSQKTTYPQTVIIPNNKSALSHSELFNSGQISLLNLSSFLPVLALDIKPTDLVFDACSAPGSKSALIASYLADPASSLHLNDASIARAARLKANLARLNIPVHKISCLDLTLPKSLHKLQPFNFNKILIDAPCSGDGTINLQDFKSVLAWTPAKVKRLAKKQYKILRTIWQLAPVDAEIVYSTCTASPEENEVLIASFLRKHPDAELQDLSLVTDNLEPALSLAKVTQFNKKDLSEVSSKTVRVFPDQNYIAFFVAKLKKIE